MSLEDDERGGVDPVDPSHDASPVQDGSPGREPRAGVLARHRGTSSRFLKLRWAKTQTAPGTGSSRAVPPVSQSRSSQPEPPPVRIDLGPHPNLVRREMPSHALTKSEELRQTRLRRPSR